MQDPLAGLRKADGIHVDWLKVGEAEQARRNRRSVTEER
jgi:hypothetical protein